MPNKIKLSTVESKLPNFVKINQETYKGIRYKCEFIDIDYNEKFEAIPAAVIKLQHGCKSRSNYLRSQALLNKKRNKIDLEIIISKLPNHLEIDRNTYKGVRQKAKFYDKELGFYFEALVCNVIRYNKGYYGPRKINNFIKKVSIPLELIQKRIFQLYGSDLQIIPETYKNTNSTAKFITKDNNIISYSVGTILSERFKYRKELNIWSQKILNRFNFQCYLCGNKENLETHHLNSWKAFPNDRFDIFNGVCLCDLCHNEFHSNYPKDITTKQDFEQWVFKKKPIDFNI